MYNLFRMLKCDRYEQPCRNLFVLVGNYHNYAYLDFLTNVENYELVGKYLAQDLQKNNMNCETHYNINNLCKNEERNNLETEIDPNLRYISITSRQLEKYLV